MDATKSNLLNSNKVGKSQPKSSRRTLTLAEYREDSHLMTEGYEEAARRKGWDFYQLKEINSDKLARFDIDDIPLDFVVFRAMKNNYQEIERLFYWLRNHDKITVNTQMAGDRASATDKHFQEGLFLMDPFLRPYVLPTYEAKSKANVLSYIYGNRVHFPIVLKVRNGSIGEGITLIKEEVDLDKIKNFSNLLIQQYVEPECDFRVFVIGGTAVYIMRKYGDPKDPSNFKAWSAGRKKYIEEDPEVKAILGEIGTRVTADARLEYTGVDIVKEAKTGKYYIMETNICAGWRNFLTFKQLDVPGSIVDWMGEIADGRERPYHEAVVRYLENRRKYLPERIQKSCSDIMNGVKKAIEPYRKIFANYPDKHLYDAGKIFERLSKAYDEITNNPGSYFDIQPGKIAEIQTLIREIESMPFSWAGNFVGPEVGTLHDGAILSSLYLFLRHKIELL